VGRRRATLDLYGHLFPDANRGVLASLDALTAPSTPIERTRRKPLPKEKSPQAGNFKTGATGLEPATSGVTGLFQRNDDWRRLTRNRSIDVALRALVSDLRTIA